MAIPLLVGVVGHRKVLKEYQGPIKQEISTQIDQLVELASKQHTEVFIVTSLAEGSDRLAAELAIEKKLKLVVPLPKDEHDYKRDFPSSVEEYEFLASASIKKFVTEGSGVNSYDNSSRWIAKHCQIVIAVWDGSFDDVKPGGTSHTVDLRVSLNKQEHSLENIAGYLGPVLHISCPKQSGEVLQKTVWIWPEGASKLSISEYLQPVFYFNTGVLNLDSEKLITSLNYLSVENHLNSMIATTFAQADVYAMDLQKKYIVNLALTILTALSGYAIQQTVSNWVGALSSSLLITFALVMIVFANRRRYLTTYLEYRGLAEVLRISYFWKVSGIKHVPTDRFLNHHWGHLSWIRNTINALWIDDNIRNDIELAKKDWIDDQLNYYQEQQSKLQETAGKWNTFSLIMFIASMFLAWLSFLIPNYSDSLISWSGVFLLLSAAVNHYVHVRAFEAHALRYKAITTPFRWAKDMWNYSSYQEKQKIVNELGSEAAAEISNWLETHRTRPNKLLR
ncbi:hypothetical protein [Thiomicrorhabdus cannonii]|uniref:hypothetical protein n=1 Tax=Thiomicrorhabdus cannonii TaxID=2748011 RepID=UPI0015B79FA7|nr:hypothetical protein [Thiomicrorhabdus cannonii]